MNFSIRPGFPRVGDGYQADIVLADLHLRLFAEAYELGYVAVVHDMKLGQAVAKEDADGLDSAKARAEELAAGYLKHAGRGELPTVEWHLNPQSRSPQAR